MDSPGIVSGLRVVISSPGVVDVEFPQSSKMLIKLFRLSKILNLSLKLLT